MLRLISTSHSLQSGLHVRHLSRVFLTAACCVFAALSCTSGAGTVAPSSTAPTDLSPAASSPAVTANALPSPSPDRPGGPVPSQVPFPTPRPPSPSATPRPPGPPAIVPTGGPVVRRQEIPSPPARDIYELGRRLILKTKEPPARIVDPPPPILKEGDTLRLWINRSNGNVQVDAVVARVSANAYWLFDTSVSVDQRGLDTAVNDFEQTIWPRVTGVFGPVWTPGIDSDPHLLIMHTSLRPGVAGYFSGADAYPRSIQKHSNEREIIYLSSDSAAPGTRTYLATLAHELQHASHWAADPDEDTWVNEGLSEVASEVAGFRVTSVAAYLRQPDTSLTEWAQQISDSSPNYGASALFFEYFRDHYGGEEALKAIVKEPAEGLEALDRYLERSGYRERALDVFRDWLVATYLDEPSGAYSYPGRDLRQGVRLRTEFILTPATDESSLPPLGARFYSVAIGSPEVRLEFQGDAVAEIFPARPTSGDSCWWGNAGDAIDTTLTRRVDLRGLQSGSTATLKFSAWFDIEEQWDYAYVMASTDDGSTWEPVKTGYSTDNNPNGNSYGHAYTGTSRSLAPSGVWLTDSADLSAYAGQEVLVRFEYITDDAVHGRGVCFDDFSIPELGWQDDAEAPGDWTAAGFARISNLIPQDYLVQVIRQPSGGQVTVSQVTVRPDGTGEATISGLAPDEKLTVIVSPVTAGVAGSARYSLKVARGG